MLVLIFILSFFTFPSFAAQPAGLILPPPIHPKGMRVLRNKHITYSDEEFEKKEKKEIKGEEEVVLRTRFKVKGRSRPSRDGSVMAVIDGDELVEPIKDSKDRKWKAILVKKTDIKVWVPSTALLREKVRKNSHSSSESSEALSDDADSEE
jgi:hypothetical protein